MDEIRDCKLLVVSCIVFERDDMDFFEYVGF